MLILKYPVHYGLSNATFCNVGLKFCVMELIELENGIESMRWFWFSYRRWKGICGRFKGVMVSSSFCKFTTMFPETPCTILITHV